MSATPYRNQNPRIGDLLEQFGASNRTKNVLWQFRMKGVRWLQKHWPEEKMRKRLPGYGPDTSAEWNAILKRRGCV
mgnify:FL=1